MLSFDLQPHQVTPYGRILARMRCAPPLDESRDVGEETAILNGGETPAEFCSVRLSAGLGNLGDGIAVFLASYDQLFHVIDAGDPAHEARLLELRQLSSQIGNVSWCGIGSDDLQVTTLPQGEKSVRGSEAGMFSPVRRPNPGPLLDIFDPSLEVIGSPN